jgi:hypothetical protein
MKFRKLWMSVAMAGLMVSAGVAMAGDNYAWMSDFNIQAEADPSGFRAQLATRFKVGDAQVKLVLGDVGRPAYAYMVFRLGEISGRSPQYVLEKYKARKGKGWGVLAQSLGIKPGSKEFQALKRNSDFTFTEGKYNGKDKARGKDGDKDRDDIKGHGHGNKH